LQAYPATQHAQQTPAQAHTAKKLAQHGKNRSFWPILGTLGEKFRVCNARTPCRANFLPQTTTHQPRSAHAPVQNSPGIPHLKAKPEQNSPGNPRLKANRYKTLPAQEKPPISAHLARAGRKISRSRRKQPEQGESFPADHHPPPTQRTRPGTKLSQRPPPQGQTGTKLSQHPPPQDQTGTKLSQHTACKATTGTKLSQHSKKHLFQPIRGEQG